MKQRMKQKMKQRIIEISKIKIDKEMYPRMQMDWVTSARYYNALKSGAKFPPITVARFENEYYLVDGCHRLNAFKSNKLTHIQAEILEGLNKKEIFIEAVLRNISHGRQFSTQEVTKICITLKDWNISQKVISEIVRIPADHIDPFVAKRMARVIGTNQQIPLKAPLQNLAGFEVKEEFNQGKIANTSQISVLDNLITLLENNWIDAHDEIVMEKLQKIYNLIINSYL